VSQFARRTGVNGDQSYYFILSYVVVQRRVGSGGVLESKGWRSEMGGFRVMRQYRTTGGVYWGVFFIAVGRVTVLVLRVYGCSGVGVSIEKGFSRFRKQVNTIHTLNGGLRRE
jgi:hypothetical protein